MSNKKDGFTLLELMVAMGILAALIGLSIIGIQTVQRSLRNTQRGDAMSAVQLSATQYKIDRGRYPRLGSELEFRTDGIYLDGTILYELGEALSKGSATDRVTTAYCYHVEPNNGAFRLGYLIEGGNVNNSDDWKQFGDSDSICASGTLVQ